MNTYKVIEKPSGLLGITFEDFAVLMGVVLLTLFPINLLKVWIALPKALTVASYLLILATYILLRRINKKKVPGYLYSWLAYRLLTPRHLYIEKNLEFLHPDANKKKETLRKGPRGRHPHPHP